MKNSLFVGLLSVSLACSMFLAAEWWYFRQQNYGGWFSATGDPSTVLPALGLVFLGLAVPFFLTGRDKLSLKRQWILLLALVALLVTVSTGWVLTGQFFTPGGVYWNSYGFPIPWRVDIMYSCPPWCISNTTSFQAWAFAVDLVFYLALAYAFALVAKPFSRGLAHHLRRKLPFTGTKPVTNQQENLPTSILTEREKKTRLIVMPSKTRS